MADERIIISIESNIATQQQAVDGLRLSILNLRDEQKKQLDQAKAEGKSAEDINKLKIQQKNEVDKLNESLKNQSKQLKILSDIQNSEADTIKRTKAELAAITAQWNESYKVNGKNSESTKALASEKLRLTEILKREEKATGDTRRNVGNYTEGIREAISETGLFSKELGYLDQSKRTLLAVTKLFASSQKVETATTNENTISTEANTAAVGSNTVADEANASSTLAVSAANVTATATTGIFTGALKLLRIALISTGIGALVVGLGSLIAYFTKSEEGGIKFQKVLASVGAFAKNLTDVALNLGGAIVSVFTGDFTAAKEKWNKAMIEAKDIMKDTNDEAKRGMDIIDQKEALEDIEIENIKKIADLEKQVARERLRASELRNTDTKGALAATDKAIALEMDLLKLREEEANRKHKIAQDELANINEQSSEYDEFRRKEAEAYANLIQLQTNNFMARKKLMKERNTFENEINAEEEKRIKERQDLIEKYAKDEAELMQSISEETEKSIAATSDKLQKTTEANLKLTTENAEKAADIVRQLNSNELAQLAQDYNFKKQLIEQYIKDEEAKKAALIKLQEDYSKAVEDIEWRRRSAQLKAISQTLSIASELFAEQTAAYKILASAQALIDTYVSANSAYRSVIGIPVVGAVLAPIAAGVAVASGLANVAKINNIKFAQGGILEGNSHAQGGIKMFGKGGYFGEAEGGEVILTKNVSKNPELLSAASNLNQMAGGRAFFAQGGIVTPPQLVSNNIRTTQVVAQPVLVVQDVTELQGVQSKVKAMAID